ncbi:hypothetical protein QAD02_022580 [Eretmocerus hayati]|uniref:Uncharacterized protein n=1 Tax=Eretmocerus hayati TaxID=131215 RepID=A0ACC2PVG9_9HYME|nr:hypothetical protein QAD02_022580 [Eretmocerus hayati]
MEESRTQNVINQDPDYAAIFSSEATRQDLFETNARTNVEKRIHEIIDAEFTNEINNKKKEVFKISKSLRKACRLLHYLRFAIITDFYNEESSNESGSLALKQTRPHSAIINSIPTENNRIQENAQNTLQASCNSKRRNTEADTETQVKIPHLASEDQNIETPCVKAFKKSKRRIIVGNISKWIPPELRYNNASHKWTVYVRDSQKCDIGLFVSKVRFFLHPSYKPNDVVELTSPPFHLVRHGWGEFPVRVQLHFVNDADKPVDVIHHLKLDRTFTGLQTIGSETIVDLWIGANEEPVRSEDRHQNSVDHSSVLEEKCDSPKTYNFLIDHDYFGFTETSNQKIPHSEGKLVLSGGITTQSLNSLETITHEKSQTSNHTLFPQESKLTNCDPIDKQSLGKVGAIQRTWSTCSLTAKKDQSFNPQSECSDKNMVLLIELTKKSRMCSLLAVFKFIIRRMPLFTEKSLEPHYKMLHPYACEDYQTYINYSRGKQLGLERQRALAVLNVLEEVKYMQNTWTVKELIIWARRYCYTPIYKTAGFQRICLSKQKFDLENHHTKYQSSSTLPKQLDSWLLDCQKSEPLISNNTCKDDDEIDVLTITTEKSNSLSKHNNSVHQNSPVISLEYCRGNNDLDEYTWRTVQKLGLKLNNEQIIPGVSANISNSLISRAVECLMDDLIRLSFSCAVDRCEDEKDSISIKLEDVQMALLKREEFDIFTNSGLGSDS